MKNKSFSPCKEYIEYQKLKESREKCELNLNKLSDPHSEMVKSISEGLIKKHGIEFDVKAELHKLQQNYIIKIQTAEKRLIEFIGLWRGKSTFVCMKLFRVQISYDGYCLFRFEYIVVARFLHFIASGVYKLLLDYIDNKQTD